MKYAIIAAMVLITAPAQLVGTNPVQPVRYCPRGGYCPPGTCLKFNPWARVQYACNVAVSCGPANCRR
jgi:hypothetical protein